MKIAIALVLGLCAVLGSAYPQPGPDNKQPDGYFQYVNVPAHKEYEFGWNRGNPHHYISRYEQSKDHRFRTRVRWGDKHGGYGEQYWEYNHGPKYKHDDHHQDHHQDSYGKDDKFPSPPKYSGGSSGSI
eukprot:maker-scaffold199_size265817-snap-gene-1.40 protein:Tk08938 transcript:maker-scaffold199_size265817-snap-gene-1.40-mRNA-1 annotation:"hypothetical protein DAPPUDRAFT_336272"